MELPEVLLEEGMGELGGLAAVFSELVEVGLAGVEEFAVGLPLVLEHEFVELGLLGFEVYNWLVVRDLGEG